MKREQRETDLRDQIWNIAPSPLPSLMVIQAHMKKAKHRAVTAVINQKQGQKEALSLAPGKPALSSRAGRPLCSSHGKLLPPGAGGREFPCPTSAQLCHISRHCSETLRGHSPAPSGSGGQRAPGQVAAPCRGVRIAYQRGGWGCVGGRLGLPTQLPHDMSGILARAVPQIHTASSHPAGSSPGWGQEPQ